MEMKPEPRTSPIALFVALSRAARDAAVPDDVRAKAFDALDNLARGASGAGFEAHHAALIALSTRHAALAVLLQPHLGQLADYLQMSSAPVTEMSR